jgi:hypothetical protein
MKTYKLTLKKEEWMRSYTSIAFFSVEGVRQLTAAGAQYDHVIHRRQFAGIG